MLNELLYSMMALFALLFILILCRTKNNPTYWIYFLSGALLGFYFDSISIANSYYNYADFYSYYLLSVPLSMTITEGLAVAIFLYFCNYIISCIRTKSLGLRNLP